MIRKLLLSKSLLLKTAQSLSKKSSNLSTKLLCLGMFFVLNLSYGQVTWTGSTGDGNWNTAANWNSNSVPTILQDVIIPNGSTTNLRTVTVNTAAVCKSLTIAGGADINTVTISGTNSLTISGAVNIGAGIGNLDTKTINIGAGSLSCASISMVAAGNANRKTGLLLSSGTATVLGNITMADANNVITFSGSAILNIGGTMTSGTLTPSTGTVNYNNIGTQTIGNYPYYNLVLSGNTGAVKTFAAASSSNSISIKSGISANLGTFTHTTNTLAFAGTNQTLGTWGSTTSSASYRNNTYFAASSGIVNVGKTYCTLNFNNVIPITNVVFNTISNSSSALTSSPAYESFINYKTNVTRGQSYPITIQGNTDGNYRYNYIVFFDWNQDGVFSSGESVNIGTITNSTGIDGKNATTSISIPTTALLGTTRMRIISHYNTYNTTPCTSVDGNSFGQVEDYTINVEAACSTPNPGNILTTTNPVCANVPFTLSVENPSSGGATYQWETSTDNVNWISATPAPVTLIDTDFSTIPTNGTILGANTKIIGGELILTPSADSYTGGYLINTSPGSNITPFTASFDFRMYDGTAADGMSLSYAPDLNLSSPGGGEEGEGSGFILKLDTYDNVVGQKTGSMIRIFYGGAQIFANSLNPFNLRDPAYRTAMLAVDSNGLLSFKIGSTTIVSGLSVPNYVAADKTNWKFKFSARSGGQYDKHSLDKILIQCGDVSSKNPTFTTSQTVPTFYQVKVTCGTTVISGPILITMPIGPTIVKSSNITCTSSSRGSIDLSGLPSTGTWTLNQTGTATATITGTGTTYSVSNLSVGTYKFTITDGTCTTAPTSDVIINDQSSTTWDGSTWSAGLPDATKNVIFASASPITTDLSACACTVNTGVNIVVPAGRTLNVKNAVTVLGTGSLTFDNTASLVQDANTTTNSNVGSITYKRNTAPVRRYDFTYWSSPVNGFALNSLIANTEYNRFNPSTGWVSMGNGASAMTQGVGYSVLAPQTNSLTVGSVYGASFVGVPNNGDVNVTPVPTLWNLIGNPYPSALDADKFINENAPTVNPTIEGTLYFWTHNTSPANTDPAHENIYYYTTDDYAAYNLSGSVSTSGEAISDKNAANNAPTGNIASGQAFFVKALTTNPIKFNNKMRLAGADNSQFFKTSKSNAVKDRVWLNFKNKKGAFKQILVGYYDGATNSWDSNYDAATFSVNPYVDFYSINETEELVIQGRALPFENTDQIPLGYGTTIDGEFTIAIDHTEGLFDNQTVYLEDKTTGVIHNLSTNDYTFNVKTGTFPDRFVLRYTNKTLGTGDFDNLENGILVSVKNKTIDVLSSKENIKEVSIYDITGKLLYNKKKVSNTELKIQNLPSSNQVLLVKVTLENDFTTTQKIIFQ